MKKKISKILRIIVFGFCIPVIAIQEKLEKPKPTSRRIKVSKFAPRGFFRPVTEEIYKTVVVED